MGPFPALHAMEEVSHPFGGGGEGEGGGVGVPCFPLGLQDGVRTLGL